MRPPRPAERSAEAIGVDTGGTFTDVVARSGGRWVAFKLPSTPARPERAVLAGLRRAGAARGTRVRHGSTVGTNTLLERRGARVTLVTTAGFEDLIEIGRQDRPEIYALAPARVPPLVPSARRVGAVERRAADGRALVRLTAAEVRRVRGRVRRSRPGAVAVGLLHAYAAPGHERALARALRADGVPVSVSSELCPEIREYERLATTVTNAYLTPRVAAYLRAVARGTEASVEVVLSHGGLAPVAEAAREPVRQLLSGPAAGLRAARAAARACGFGAALTLDVGGTSTDCAFVGGALPRRRGREVAGFPVQLPLLDVHTVGAGGGSIAGVDAGGLLAVGPRSAGAVPGPACYGRGGPATVTDALAVLGRLPLESLAGGAQALDHAAARAAMARLGRALGCGPAAAAEGVVTLAEAHMEAALRRISIERGHDPRAAALVAYGGAGGLHACALAAALGCPAVVFPLHAGLLCALGALVGGVRRERSRSVLTPAADRAGLARALARLERAVLAEFPRRSRAAVRLERWAEARYVGQSHELPVPAGPGLEARFHREHARRFGFADRAREIEVVTLEVRAAARPAPAPRPPRPPRGGAAPERRVRVRDRGREVSAPVWRRAALPAGFSAPGPLVVLDEGATLWVPRGWRVTRHASGALVARRGGRS